MFHWESVRNVHANLIFNDPPPNDGKFRPVRFDFDLSSHTKVEHGMDMEGECPVNLSDGELTQVMSDAHLIASVGVLSDPQTTAFQVAAYQQSQGYEVVPVNETGRGDMVLGHQTVQSVEDIDGTVDIVNVFGHEIDLPAITDSAIRSGAKAIWLEPGARNPDAERRAQQAGITVVSGKSFEREHRRLLSHKPQ